MRLPAPNASLLTARRAPLVTVSGSTAELAPTIAAPAPETLSFPLSWVLEHASAPIKYRAITDVVGRANAGLGDIEWLP